jgi:uncharacterized protein YegP (UPF0339 family)
MAKRESRFEIYQGTMGESLGSWYWRLRAANGEIIADGAQGYTTKAEVRRAVKRVVTASSAVPLGPAPIVESLP